MDTSMRFAQTILHGFESYFADFQNITLAARPRFENADWAGIHAASRERIDLYKEKINKVSEFVELIAGDQLRDLDFWSAVREHYAVLIKGHNNYEIAETFFNSIYCSAFSHRKIRDEYAFVFSPHGDMPSVSSGRLWRSYQLEVGLEVFLEQMLDDYALNIPYEDKHRDIANIASVVRDFLLPRFGGELENTTAQVLDSLFFRNKGAYIVGKLVSGNKTMPFVLPLLHTEQGSVYVDTILFGADRVSVIFSFTRTYFMVDAEVPSQYVMFLQSLMPAKAISEIYSALGYYKHGKTYFYRCAVRHMEGTRDEFILAPGIKGMVMSVFTLPSYDFVFKIIKDRFTPPKDMTRAQVMDKYRLVKRSDRAGRMADTQEFTNLAFDRNRFSDELMEELHKVAPSQIEENGKALVIRHVYVERRMTPLNLYLRSATDEQIHSVMDEYGNAIRELATANIFPGDMLLKNFGVTRHGRVVFYDYDEICPLTDCNFRTIPEPRCEEEEMASSPWYSVAPEDIFPEEFRLFFSGNSRARKVFDQLHSDLYKASFWQGLQSEIRDGQVEDFFPYRRKLRFPRQVMLQQRLQG
ncbi:bifunctional isocitrate dehydrogenase kinase/phosphatase [Halieaceae bacterium IMCC14734]|uniref:Isocitrate dehydrogenase kinase/phosphatase n=1 Tax=Candidatus Litorirhabdus singularis TaxID=2518993 RepID=A0ABT3TNC3_9GAMM|nr:bifunctional isocitrate dehydrogenase kinase/phosphatase [Candidatus Litorirhabdus singularis]